MQTVLVTGGAGFIGSHLTDFLIEDGNQVIVIDNLSRGILSNVNPKANFYHADISNEIVIEKIFKQHKIDFVYHLAAIINEGSHKENFLTDILTSVIGTINLLKYSSLNKVKNFIFVSSVAVYGKAKFVPVNETHPLEPINSYGISKKFAESYVQYYSDKFNLNVQILRYSNIYGPRQSNLGEVGVIAAFTQNILNKKSFKIYGDGNQTRDMMYVYDCIRKTIYCARLQKSGVYNIASGYPSSVNKVYKLFCDFTKKKIDVQYYPMTKDELGIFYCDIKKFEGTNLDYKCEALEKGLKKTYQYYFNKL